MKFVLMFLMLSVIYIGSASVAEAGSFRFGKDEKVIKIKDVQLQGPAGEALYIGYLVETKFFGLGVHVKDKGYVIGVRGDEKGYFPIPPADKIQYAQKAGLLPEQLPQYKLSVFDYAVGYSLWIFTACLFGLLLLKKPPQRNIKKY